MTNFVPKGFLAYGFKWGTRIQTLSEASKDNEGSVQERVLCNNNYEFHVYLGFIPLLALQVPYVLYKSFCTLFVI